MASETKASFFSNLLRFVKPFVPFLPQVKSPGRSPSLREKFIWTALPVLIYLGASQIPLYGISNTNTKDDLQWLKILMASSRGTLMDLGITPVATASAFMQFFTMTGIITPDFSVKEDKILYDALQKLLAIIITIAQCVVQILSGFYGPYESLATGSSALILFQLIVSGLIIIMLDEILQKGYGIGNGVNLFIVANVCERIVWNAISPKVFYTGRGLEFEGSLVALIHVIFTRKNKLSAIYEVIFRDNLPNLASLAFTFFIFAFVVYIQSIRVEIPIISSKHKGVTSTYPIPLMYVSTTPLLMQSTVVSQFFNCSRLLSKFYPKLLFVKLLGVWEFKARLGYVPNSGLCYYIFPPTSYKEIFTRPIFFTAYLTIMLGTSALISILFLESQEDNPAAVFKRIKAQDMQLKGIRDANSVEKLNDYISVAAFLSGVVTSFVSQFCDLFFVVGSGSNIFLAANILNQYFKLFGKESMKRSGKAFID